MWLLAHQLARTQPLTDQACSHLHSKPGSANGYNQGSPNQLGASPETKQRGRSGSSDDGGQDSSVAGAGTQRSVLLRHPQGSHRHVKWRCPCGSRTQGLAEHPGPGAMTRFWEAQAPHLASPTGEQLQVLGKGTGSNGEETGAQPPEERGDDGVTGKVTLPRAGVNNPWRGHRRRQLPAEQDRGLEQRCGGGGGTRHTAAAGGLAPRPAMPPPHPARVSPLLPRGGDICHGLWCVCSGQGVPIRATEQCRQCGTPARQGWDSQGCSGRLGGSKAPLQNWSCSKG